MAVINYSKKEISAKIVYYGPSLCGKTTNIQSIYASIKPDQKGKLVSLATEADRTLFFDFLPIEIANIRGFKTRLHFYTVPGQVYYNSTRRAVLTGVDGLVFVADSQRDKMEENIESLNNLEENLNYYGKSIKTIPIVIQYNKRDLADVTSDCRNGADHQSLWIPIIRVGGHYRRRCSGYAHQDHENGSPAYRDGNERQAAALCTNASGKTFCFSRAVPTRLGPARHTSGRNIATGLIPSWRNTTRSVPASCFTKGAGTLSCKANGADLRSVQV